MFVKVCGIRHKIEIDWAIELGYTAIGVVLCPLSKRFVNKEKAIELAKYCKKRIISVAVGINYSDVKDVEDFFDYIQISEDIKKKNVILSVGEDINDYTDRYLIFDKSRGSGIFSQYPLWIEKYINRLIIAGGLNDSNVADVVNLYKPFGVDVSSGVEDCGLKSYEKMFSFIREVKNGYKQNVLR